MGESTQTIGMMSLLVQMDAFEMQLMRLRGRFLGRKTWKLGFYNPTFYNRGTTYTDEVRINH